MDVTTLIGLAAGLLTTISLVPQAMKIWKTKSATPLGKETPENRDKERSGKAIVQSLAQQRASS